MSATASQTTSTARAAFEQNLRDVERLIEIHGDVSGAGVGRKHGVEVLNKSAIVLMSAVWEAYCEDLTAEALDHLVTHAQSADELPKELRKQIATEVKEEVNQLAVWQLAGNEWRTYVRDRLARLADERNRALNTPKAGNIDDLFLRGVGLKSVSSCWEWHKTTPADARRRLDEYVTLRGDIAHRAQSLRKVSKHDAVEFVKLARKLVRETDAHVNDELRDACGTPLF